MKYLVVLLFLAGCGEMEPNFPYVPESLAAPARRQTENYFEVLYGLSPGWATDIHIKEAPEDFLRGMCENYDAPFLYGCSNYSAAFIEENNVYASTIRHELCHIGAYALTGDADHGHKNFPACYWNFAIYLEVTK